MNLFCGLCGIGGIKNVQQHCSTNRHLKAKQSLKNRKYEKSLEKVIEKFAGNRFTELVKKERKQIRKEQTKIVKDKVKDVHTKSIEDIIQCNIFIKRILMHLVAQNIFDTHKTFIF